jgi:uncharacterized protein involved in exopolysaccharide biosynthesis/Mrp family chromosome partitioning ATPase
MDYNRTALATSPGSALAIPRGTQLAVPQPQPQQQMMPTPPESAPLRDCNQGTVHVQVNLLSLIACVHRYWKVGVAIGAILATSVFIILGFAQKQYETEARLLVRFANSNVFNFTEMGASILTDQSAPSMINNHRAELSSRQFVEYFFDKLPEQDRLAFIDPEGHQPGLITVVGRAIGLFTTPPEGTPKDSFALIMAEDCRIEAIKDSHILRVIVRHRDPNIAVSVANSYAQRYVDYVGDHELGTARASSVFLAGKSDELLMRLQASETELKNFRAQANLVQDSASKEIEGQKTATLTKAISDASVLVTQLRNELNAIEATREAGQSLADIRSISITPEVLQLRSALEAARTKLAETSMLCGAMHPRVIDLTQYVTDLQERLNLQAGIAASMIAKEQANMTARIADLENQLVSSRKELLAMDDKEAQQKRLRDQIDRDTKIYQNVMLRRDQADITSQFKDHGMLRVSDVARLPERPLKPNKLLAAVAAMIMFGLCLVGVPVGIGYGKEFYQQAQPALQGLAHRDRPDLSGRSAETHEQALVATPFLAQPMAPPLAPPSIQQPIWNGELPVLAVIPNLGRQDPESLLKATLWNGVNGGPVMGPVVNMLKHRASQTPGPRVVVMTSAQASEGKSFVAAALAAQLCRDGQRVFLMDCHVGSPTVDNWFPAARWLASNATSLEELRYGNSNLFLLPGHDLPDETMSELAHGYTSWIARAQSQVDWIILDCASILAGLADVASLLQVCNDVLIVTNPDCTNARQMQGSLSLLQRFVTPQIICGTIVNHATLGQ